MKKNIISLSLALAIIFGGSCKKSTDPLVTPTSVNAVADSTVKLKSGRLVFNQEYYESLSDSTNAVDEAIHKIETLDFQSIGTQGPSEHCRVASEKVNSLPDFIKNIVNADGILQIGNHIMKLNFEKEKVFVLNVKFENEINDLLSENLNNTHIEVYGMEEDVLSLLADRSAKVSICFKKGAPSKSTNGSIGCMGYNPVNVALKYEKFGVYFELNVDIRTNSSSDKRAFKVDYYAWYEKKCSGKTYVRQNVATETNDKVVVKQYKGTAALSSFYLEAGVYCVQAGCNYYYGTLSH